MGTAEVGGLTDPQTVKAKVVLLGARTAHKEDLIRPHVHSESDERFFQTFGASVTQKTVTVGDRRGAADVQVVLRMWDIADLWGSSPRAGLRAGDLYRGAEGILAVADATQPDTLRGLAPLLDTVHSIAGPIPTFILVRTDPDRAALDEGEVAEVARAHDAQFAFVPPEAEDGCLVIEEAFRWLAGRLADRRP